MNATPRAMRMQSRSELRNDIRDPQTKLSQSNEKRLYSFNLICKCKRCNKIKKEMALLTKKELLKLLEHQKAFF